MAQLSTHHGAPIDFSMDISRVADPNVDRVKIVLNGKFLPYKTY